MGKHIASSNRCLTSSNKKLLELLVPSSKGLVTRSDALVDDFYFQLPGLDAVTR